MERITLSYLLKTIPVPSEKSYQLHVIDEIECVVKQMRWKAQFFLNNANNSISRMVKETNGFKYRHYPCKLKEVETFEKDLYNIVSSLKYKNSTDQKQLKEDILSIKSSQNVFIFADQTEIYTKHQQNNAKSF